MQIIYHIQIYEAVCIYIYFEEERYLYVCINYPTHLAIIAIGMESAVLIKTQINK